ncbi:MAG: DNA-processing protein DprA [Parcubacteria group bacterium]|nr:DNA-processing protein DprA [Parcubacteria group bacterium]
MSIDRKDSVFIIKKGDEAYPPALNDLYDPPTQLYARGDMKYDFERSLAVVGTRKMSAYGKAVVEQILAY